MYGKFLRLTQYLYSYNNLKPYKEMFNIMSTLYVSWATVFGYSGNGLANGDIITWQAVNPAQILFDCVDKLSLQTALSIAPVTDTVSRDTAPTK